VAVTDIERWQALQPGHETLGLDSPMCFYIAYDHVDARRIDTPFERADIGSVNFRSVS